MVIRKNLHTIIELTEEEAHLLKDLLERVGESIAGLEDAYGNSLERLRTDILFGIPPQR